LVHAAVTERQAELPAELLVHALAPADADQHPVATEPAPEWYRDLPDHREPAVDLSFP